jgi:type II secretory pathway pseudopilin PulG
LPTPSKLVQSCREDPELKLDTRLTRKAGLDTFFLIVVSKMANDFSQPSMQQPMMPHEGSKSTLTIVVVVLAGLLFFSLACGGVLLALVLPAVQSARETARRMSCENNLAQIQLAILNYETANRHWPPAYTVDAQGQKLHSWRTLILPYLGQSALHSQIDLTKPWNHPDNRMAYDSMVRIYSCPSSPNTTGTETHYLAIVDPTGVFLGEKAIRLSEITDGTSNTISIVEASKGVHWMEPTDLSLAEFLTSAGQSSHPRIANAVRADRKVIPIDQTLPKTALGPMVTRNGND